MNPQKEDRNKNKIWLCRQLCLN